MNLLSFVFLLVTTRAQALPIHQTVDFEKAMSQFNTVEAYNFLGTVKLSGCSGSLIRFENSKDTDPGIILTNGHCVQGPHGDMMGANEFISHRKEAQTFRFLAADGSLKTGSETSVELLFATITWNDIALFKLQSTYAQIKKNFGVDALLLDSKHPKVGIDIEVLSGYWHQGYSCKIETFVYELHEEPFVSKDSMRYSANGCHTIHGTSGSPVISHESGKVVGINSTGNDNGERCTMDNPCEVSANGDVFYQKGLSYADQTYVIYSCLNQASEFDLTQAGCKVYH